MSYLDLIKFTSNGIEVKSYNKIREKFVERYKAIYGSDIDVSSTSADGQWIEELSLLHNNILQLIQLMYSNLDPRTATGEFLDIIASYTNVVRLPATKSTVNVKITGLDEGTSFTVANPLVLLDRAGKTWTCQPFTVDSSEESIVIATCDEFGPIRAEVGWIYTSVQVIGGLEITMLEDAIPGSYREDDGRLRARRNESLSSRGITVIESLNAALLNISGIEDVQVYNNDTGTTLTAKDTTAIAANSIYIIIRKNPNITIDNALIGSLIYEKKTSGIATAITGASSANASPKQYLYPTSLEGITQSVNWKQCVPLNPTIVIKLNPRNFFVEGSSDKSTGVIVGKSIINYLNNLRISQDIVYLELSSEVLYSDPLYRNVRTFDIVSIETNGVSSNFTNPDTYFNYTNVVISDDSGNVVITLT